METKPSPKAESKQILTTLASGDDAAAAQARAGLRDAGQALSDAIAKRLVSALKAGGTPTTDALRILAELDAPLFGVEAWQQLVGTLYTVDSRNQAAVVALINEFPRLKDESYASREPKPRKARTGLPWRIGGLWLRPWAFGVMLLPLVLCVVWTSVGSSSLGPLALFSTSALLVGVVGAYLRRCFGCHKWLAGAIDRTEVAGTYATASESGYVHEHNIYRYYWKCVHCQRTWES